MNEQQLSALTSKMSDAQKTGALHYLIGAVKTLGSVNMEVVGRACEYGVETYPGREPDDEPPSSPETEAEEWDRNTADNESFLNRERHR